MKLHAIVFDDPTGAVATVKLSEDRGQSTIRFSIDRPKVNTAFLHLTQERVRELLPMFQQFAETGEMSE